MLIETEIFYIIYFNGFECIALHGSCHFITLLFVLRGTIIHYVYIKSMTIWYYGNFFFFVSFSLTMFNVKISTTTVTFYEIMFWTTSGRENQFVTFMKDTYTHTEDVNHEPNFDRRIEWIKKWSKRKKSFFFLQHFGSLSLSHSLPHSVDQHWLLQHCANSLEWET